MRLLELLCKFPRHVHKLFSRDATEWTDKESDAKAVEEWGGSEYNGDRGQELLPGPKDDADQVFWRRRDTKGYKNEQLGRERLTTTDAKGDEAVGAEDFQKMGGWACSAEVSSERSRSEPRRLDTADECPVAVRAPHGA
jgi:hypothetical protein